MTTFIELKSRIRHSFPRMIQLYSLFSSIITLYIHCVEGANDFEVPKPTKTQAKWLDYEVGAIVHFNMQTFDRYMKPGESQLVRLTKDVVLTKTECLLGFQL